MTFTIETITAVLDEGKGENITVLPTERQSGGLFSYMVIVTAGSGRHATALANRILKAQKDSGIKKSKPEMSEEREWILIDCGDIIVHLMQDTARERYGLENLWGFEGD